MEYFHALKLLNQTESMNIRPLLRNLTGYLRPCILLFLIVFSDTTQAQTSFAYVPNLFTMNMAAPGRMITGDFDDDGDTDILYQSNNDAGLGFCYFRNNGNSSFSNFSSANTPGLPFANFDFTNGGVNAHQLNVSGLIVVDYDSDGDDDIVDREGGAIGIWQNNAGVFSFIPSPFTMTMSNSGRMLFGDFDNDGDKDIIYQDGNVAGVGIGYVRRNANGTYTNFPNANAVGTPFTSFNFATASAQITPAAMYVFDYDNDGDVDIIDREGTTSGVWINNAGVFSLAPSNPFNMTMTPLGRLVFSDFDDDGDTDVLYQNGNVAGVGIGYMKNNGGGNYTNYSNANSAGTPFTNFDFTIGGIQVTLNNVVPMDIDNDGDLDILDREGAVLTTWKQVGQIPALLSSVPADNSTGFAIGANIVLTFNMPVTKNTGNIYIVRTSDNAIIQTISVGSSAVTGSGTTWTIDLPADLAAATNYAVRYDAGIFRSADLVDLPAINDNTILNFTTVAAQAPPVIDNLNGDVAFFTEGGAPVRLDQGVSTSVIDNDSPDFNGGNLTVEVTANASAGDLLAVSNYGPITVTGSNVSYNGNVIGTWSWSNNTLTISFNSALAGSASVSSLMQAITFVNTSDAPFPTARSIKFVVRDGDGGSVAATVTCSVNAVNDTPVITVSPAAFTVNEDASVYINNFSLSDPDISTANGRLRISATSGSLSAQTQSGITIVGNNSNSLELTGTINNLNSYVAANKLSYFPSANFNGVVTVSVNFNDLGNTGSGGSLFDDEQFTVNVTAVNDAPSVTAPVSIAVVEDESSAITGISFTDVDAGTASVTASFAVPQGLLYAVSGGNVTVANSGTNNISLTGTISAINAFIAGSGLKYLTSANASGNVTLTATISDGSLSASTTLPLVVTAVNDAPVITAPATITGTEDATVFINSITLSDVDGGLNTMGLSITVANGTLYATSANGVTVTGSGSGTLTLSGTLSALNAFITGNNIIYSPAANFNGSAVLIVNATDYGNTGSGGPQNAAEVQITLEIAGVNDAPQIFFTAPFFVTEDQPTAITPVFDDIDGSNGTVRVTFGASAGIYSATSGGGVTVTNSGTGMMLLEGTLTAINAFVGANKVTYTTALNDVIAASLSLRIDDNGNTGTGGNLFITKAFSPTITQVNDAPVISGPTTQNVDMNGTLVFSTGNSNVISVADVDLGSGLMKVTLTVTNGVITLGGTTGLAFSIGGGSSNGQMEFMGTISNVNAALNGLKFIPTSGYYGPASLVLNVSDQGATGSGGAKTDTKTIGINVVPTFPEVVSITSTTANGTYMSGNVVKATITFNMAVNVTGNPQLLLETGSTDRQATYESGSGSSTITFSYTVQPGDLTPDLDYASTSALTLNSGTIKNIALLDANLVLPTPGAVGSLGANKSIVIDGAAPNVSSVAVPANGVYKGGNQLDFTVNFSETVNVVTTSGTPHIQLQIGSATVQATYLSGTGSSALTFRYTVGNGDLDLDGILIQALNLNGGTIIDLAGNVANSTLNGVGSTANVMVDAVPPTVTSVTPPAAKSWKAGEMLNFTVNFSENVAVTGTPAIEVVIGAATKIATYTSGSGTAALTFRYEIQPGDTDADGIAIGSVILLNGGTIMDGATNPAVLTLNNAGATTGVLVDTQAPTAVSITRNNASPTNASTFSYIFKVDEDVTGVDATDFTLTKTSGTAAATIQQFQQQNATTYLITIANASGTGNIRLDLNASGTGIVDAAGNAIAGGLTGATYAIDLDPPTVTAVTVPTGRFYKAGETLNFTVHFSEPVLVATSPGMPSVGIVLNTGGTVKANYSSGHNTNAIVFSYTVQNGNEDLDGITLQALLQLNSGILSDAVGNAINTTLNGVPSTADIKVDAVVPNVTVNSNSALLLNAPYTVTVAFTENVTGFTDADITVTNGAVSGFTAVDGKTYTAVITPAVDGIVSVKVNVNTAQDQATNPNTASNTLIRTYDATRPDVKISAPAETGKPYTATVSFSEAVTAFAQSNINVTNATLSGFTKVNDRIYTVVVTPTRTGVSSVSVPANITTDLAGNSNTASAVFTTKVIFSGSVKNVYPVPARGVLNVELDGIINDKARIVIKSFAGHIVYDEEVPAKAQKFVINLHGLRPGMYFMAFRTNGLIYHKKFLVVQ